MNSFLALGFADSASFAISIPFVASQNGEGGFESYWTSAQEAQIIQLIRLVLSHPNIRIVGQNFIYDTQFIQHWFGVTPRLSFDTMLAQNVIFPGTPKDLGYLSSLYCQYHWYWKDDVKDWRKLGGIKQLLEYNCIDVLRTWEIAQAQKAYIAKIGQEGQVEFKMETSRLCLRMMNRGVLFDKRRAGTMLFELQAALTAFHQELLAIIPQDWVQPHKTKKDAFWYNSPKQTATLFYDILRNGRRREPKNWQSYRWKRSLNGFRAEVPGVYRTIQTSRLRWFNRQHRECHPNFRRSGRSYALLL